MFNTSANRLLAEVVADQIAQSPWFDNAAISASEMPAAAPLITDIAGVLVDAPVVAPSVRSPDAPAYFNARAPIKRDYLDREARNISLRLQEKNSSWRSSMRACTRPGRRCWRIASSTSPTPKATG